MPFYEYQCEKCQADFETFAKTMKDAKPACPKCGGKKVTRKISVFGVNSSESRPAAPAGGCGSCHQNGTCPMAR